MTPDSVGMSILQSTYITKCSYLLLFTISVKYLGLLAMSRILKSHPKSVQAHKDLVLACLDDKDESIRLRALGLLYGMVSIFVENLYTVQPNASDGVISTRNTIHISDIS